MKRLIKILFKYLKNIIFRKITLLYIAVIVSLVTYSGWTYFYKEFFYHGNAVFIGIICTYLYILDRKSFIKFVLFELSIANITKELFLDPTKLTKEEALLIVIVPFIWYLKNGKYNRILERNK